ncbi:MAG: STAS-like domain-containing protein [Desulfovibrio sp.]|uniref:STAS-like domain-containing protein n=1 Tax=Desulfovibrio sp. 7SRBS1 TaxID=3378064 RepID=UPI003B41457A
MNTEYKIIIKDVIGTAQCTASEDGDKVYDMITSHLQSSERILLSFEGVQDLTTAFLNAAVGRLYNGDYQYDFIAAHLLPVDTNNDDLVYLKRVVDRAKSFFKTPEKFINAESEAFGDDD